MLKHCHSSSVRLNRRYNSNNQPNADAVSLASSVATSIRSHGESSASSSADSASLNSSFSMMQHSNAMYNLRQAIYDQNMFNNASTGSSNSAQNDGGHLHPATGGMTRTTSSTGFRTPDPMSLSSRTSSYSSLFANSETAANGGTKTAIKVYASCLRSDIDYKTLSVGATTSAKEIIWQLLSKFRMKHRDPKLFFLTMEVVIQKPGRDGLTKKTLVLEEDSRPVELKNCNPWGECKFTLQMRKGGLVKVYDSILMEESQYKCLLISEDTTVDEVIRLLLYCNGLEKVERPERYCMYEQCSSQRYQRKLLNDDKPLAIQALWPGPTPFSFVLRRSLARIEENVWVGKQQPARAAVRVTPTQTYPQQHMADYPPSRSQTGYNPPSWAEWGLSDDKSFYTTALPPAGAVKMNGGGSKTTVIVGGGLHNSHQQHYGQQQHHSQHLEQVVPRLQTPESEYSGGCNMSADSPPPPPPPPAARFPRGHRLNPPQVIVSDEEESWPEVDKDSGEEEEVSCSSSGSEDMDTSLTSSSSDSSPVPPMTSTPMNAANNRMAASALQRRHQYAAPSTLPVNQSTPVNQKQPAMTFLYPSPDYESFPTSRSIPSRPYSAMSRPYSAMSTSDPSTSVLPRPPSTKASSASSGAQPMAPSLPPKPPSLVSLFTSKTGSSAKIGVESAVVPAAPGSPTEQHSGFHDYENYFYI